MLQASQMPLKRHDFTKSPEEVDKDFSGLIMYH